MELKFLNKPIFYAGQPTTSWVHGVRKNRPPHTFDSIPRSYFTNQNAWKALGRFCGVGCNLKHWALQTMINHVLKYPSKMNRRMPPERKCT